MYFQKSLDLVAQTISSVENRTQMIWIVEDLLTPQEILDIAERIRIFQEIKKWKTQRDIAGELGISVTTVNRWSRVAKFGSWEIMKII